MVKQFKPKTILEIGSANGLGSTQAFLEAAQDLEESPQMVCLEVDKDRFDELLDNTSTFPWVTCIRASSVKMSEYLQDSDIGKFMDFARKNSNLHMPIVQYEDQTVRDWRGEELSKIVIDDLPQDGIKQAKVILGKTIDMVFIDGSAFSGMAEYQAVKGAGVIILDDVLDIKNHDAYMDMMGGSEYELICEDVFYRNAYAVFRKVGRSYDE